MSQHADILDGFMDRVTRCTDSIRFDSIRFDKSTYSMQDVDAVSFDGYFRDKLDLT